ncbi:MAG TPA: hypothetical protein VIU41_03110 [Geobacteraceae bacterium]
MKGQGAINKVCAMDDMQQIRGLANQAAFVCSRCGAKAHEAANLCDAKQLPDAGWLGD